MTVLSLIPQNHRNKIQIRNILAENLDDYHHWDGENHAQKAPDVAPQGKAHKNCKRTKAKAFSFYARLQNVTEYKVYCNHKKEDKNYLAVMRLKLQQGKYGCKQCRDD